MTQTLILIMKKKLFRNYFFSPYFFCLKTKNSQWKSHILGVGEFPLLVPYHYCLVKLRFQMLIRSKLNLVPVCTDVSDCCHVQMLQRASFSLTSQPLGERERVDGRPVVGGVLGLLSRLLMEVVHGAQRVHGVEGIPVHPVVLHVSAL